jgi:26S proteasome non-ATPase regulatory subunit 9
MNSVKENENELNILVKQKDQLESEIASLIGYLNSPGNPGLSGGLIDDEGFPIGDVGKIIDVRTARNQLASMIAMEWLWSIWLLLSADL